MIDFIAEIKKLMAFNMTKIAKYFVLFNNLSTRAFSSNIFSLLYLRHDKEIGIVKRLQELESPAAAGEFA